MKGLSQRDKYPGVMNTKQSYEAMLSVEFPKMISHYSKERVEPKRHYPIMDVAIAHREKEFVGRPNTYFHLFNIGQDCVECPCKKCPTGGNMYYANDLSDLCKPITTDPIRQYQETQQGISDLDYTHRHVFAGHPCICSTGLNTHNQVLTWLCATATGILNMDGATHLW
jgi:hypothetical protein